MLVFRSFQCVAKKWHWATPIYWLVQVMVHVHCKARSSVWTTCSTNFAGKWVINPVQKKCNASEIQTTKYSLTKDTIDSPMLWLWEHSVVPRSTDSQSHLKSFGQLSAVTSTSDGSVYIMVNAHKVFRSLLKLWLVRLFRGAPPWPLLVRSYLL